MASICYIVPSYTPDEASHMAHLPRFLSEVGKYCELHVIIQRGRGQAEIPNVRSIYVQKPGDHFQRAIELVRIAYRLQRQGCKKFFVRISASAALELNLLSRLLDLQVYYWVSGQGKNMKPPWWEGLRKRMYYELGDLLLRTNMRLAHRFVTGPESMMSYFAKEYGANLKKTIVLYNDIDVEGLRSLRISISKEHIRGGLGLPLDRSIVLFVGRVSTLKGGHYLVPIARLLQKHSVTALLLIVGDIHMPHVMELASREDLGNIRFIGPVPNARIVQYYQAADIFIMPSDSEGFPRVLLEAMACGLPIVAFDVGGIKDIIHPEQFVFILPRGDVNGMVHKVAQLLANPLLRAQQAEFGLQKVGQYSTEVVAKMFVERIVLD